MWNLQNLHAVTYANPVATSVVTSVIPVLVSQTSGVTARPLFNNKAVRLSGTPLFLSVSGQHQDLKGRFSAIPHPKQRTEMSQDFNHFTTTSTGSGSSAYACSFNNNTNSFNNVSNHFTVPDDRLGVLAWLSPLEPGMRHQNLEASRVDKVGDWFLQTEQFQGWWGGSSQGESHNGTIFCYGNPGAGKTYILVGDTVQKEEM